MAAVRDGMERQSMKYFWYAMAIVATLQSSLPAAGDQAGFIPMQKKFIRELLSGKRYFDAIAETRRLMAEDRDPGRIREYLFFIDVSFFLGAQYRTVAERIGKIPEPLEYRDLLLLSQSYLRLGECGRSLQVLQGVSRQGLDQSLRYPLMARKAEAYMACGRYRELRRELLRQDGMISGADGIERLRSEMERYRTLPFKSVPLAVALSVLLPGAGQMYAGRYGYGIMSFIGVLATAAGAWYFYSRDRNISFTFMFFSGVFYLGNIYGAYNASRSFNEDLLRRYREEVTGRCIPPYDPMEQVKRGPLFR